MNCYGAHKRVVWICLFRISARTSTNVFSDGTCDNRQNLDCIEPSVEEADLRGQCASYGHKESSGCKGPNRAGDGLAMDDQINSHLVELAGYSSWYPQFVFGAPLRRRGALPFTDVWRCRHKCRGPGVSSSPGRTISNESDCLLHALIIQ